jgi:hypothetical protein
MIDSPLDKKGHWTKKDKKGQAQRLTGGAILVGFAD